MNSGCKDCTDRHKGCHSKCEKYLEYKKIIDAQNKERKQHISVICYQVEQMHKSSEIMRRKKNFRRTKK